MCLMSVSEPEKRAWPTAEVVRHETRLSAVSFHTPYSGGHVPTPLITPSSPRAQPIRMSPTCPHGISCIQTQVRASALKTGSPTPPHLLHCCSQAGSCAGPLRPCPLQAAAGTPPDSRCSRLLPTKCAGYPAHPTPPLALQARPNNRPEQNPALWGPVRVALGPHCACAPAERSGPLSASLGANLQGANALQAQDNAHAQDVASRAHEQDVGGSEACSQ